jgi:hypothetical protein
MNLGVGLAGSRIFGDDDHLRPKERILGPRFVVQVMQQALQVLQSGTKHYVHASREDKPLTC